MIKCIQLEMRIDNSIGMMNARMEMMKLTMGVDENADDAKVLKRGKNTKSLAKHFLIFRGEKKSETQDAKPQTPQAARPVRGYACSGPGGFDPGPRSRDVGPGIDDRAGAGE